MRYRNKTPFWRQAGDALIPPLGLTPDLHEAPVGNDWEPVQATQVGVTATETEAPPAGAEAAPSEALEQPKRKRGGN